MDTATRGQPWPLGATPGPTGTRFALYEAHLRSMTRLHPDVPPEVRGTYAGLAHPAVLAHLRKLGVTTLSLMPLMQRVDEPRLLRLGLTNHWGYNTIGWFCAEPR